MKKPFTDAEIKECFYNMDETGNGDVGKAEITFVLKCLGYKVEEAVVDEMIRMTNVDGDGEISYDEFYKMATGQALILPDKNKGTSDRTS